jgi:NAD(P)-dependent dehydrogenase (short-subunit alcohol dehydrogenase family)
MRLKDRHLIVTGGSRGIGAACAALFAQEGARVLVVDLEPMTGSVESLCESAKASAPADLASTFPLGDSANEPIPGNSASTSALSDTANDSENDAALSRGRILFLRGDVCERSCAEQALSMALQHWGTVDGLLNNAGIIHGCPFLELRDEDFDRVLSVNLRAYFVFSQVVARHMVAHALRGSIVNMSSVNALLAIPEQLPYAVSKGGVNQLTRVTAMALAAKGIRVNAVGPGTIATELARKAVLGSEAARRKIMSRTPLLRLGEPDEVAQVAAFLMSEEASYLTGQIVYPDGGRLALNYTTD